MTHRNCPGEGCPRCEAAISRIEDERETGRPEGMFESEVDRMLDAQAARYYEEPS